MITRDAFRTIVTATLVAACASSLRGLAPAADTPALQWRTEPGHSVALLRGEQVVWQLNHSAQENKAYFHPIALPDGPTLTWDRPPDHVWHHALWFSWKFINGVNYWEIDPQTGRPAGRTTWSNVTVETRTDFSARIRMDLAFVDPAGVAVMTGTRDVEVSAPDTSGKYHLDWTCRFTAGNKDVLLDRTPLPGEPGGVDWGGYAGLSVRFAPGLNDRRAVSSRGPIPLENGVFRGPAAAMDYSGVIGGKPVGIAICDHPSNLNHPTPWYVIASDPMSYISPAVICFQPTTVPAGKSFTLRYRVIVHPDRWDAARLRREAEQYGQPLGGATKRSVEDIGYQAAAGQPLGRGK
jgi:hypothetical protein